MRYIPLIFLCMLVLTSCSSDKEYQPKLDLQLVPDVVDMQAGDFSEPIDIIITKKDDARTESVATIVLLSPNDEEIRFYKSDANETVTSLTTDPFRAKGNSQTFSVRVSGAKTSAADYLPFTLTVALEHNATRITEKNLLVRVH